MTRKQIISWLETHQDVEYKKFHEKLIPVQHNILGVRNPDVRELASLILKQGDVEPFLSELDFTYTEEATLYGLVLGKAKLPIAKALVFLDKFMPYIDNWAVCDSSVAEMKWIGKNKEILFPVLETYISNSAPFTVRFAIVAMFRYFLDNAYIDTVLSHFCAVKSEHYYVRMAIAWGIAEVLLKYSDKAFSLLKQSVFPTWIHNKAIQKAIESRRITSEQKAELRVLRR